MKDEREQGNPENAESYIAGQNTVEDLATLLQLLILNQKRPEKAAKFRAVAELITQSWEAEEGLENSAQLEAYLFRLNREIGETITKEGGSTGANYPKHQATLQAIKETQDLIRLYKDADLNDFPGYFVQPRITRSQTRVIRTSPEDDAPLIGIGDSSTTQERSREPFFGAESQLNEIGPTINARASADSTRPVSILRERLAEQQHRKEEPQRRRIWDQIRKEAGAGDTRAEAQEEQEGAGVNSFEDLANYAFYLYETNPSEAAREVAAVFSKALDKNFNTTLALRSLIRTRQTEIMEQLYSHRFGSREYIALDTRLRVLTAADEFMTINRTKRLDRDRRFSEWLSAKRQEPRQTQPEQARAAREAGKELDKEQLIELVMRDGSCAAKLRLSAEVSSGHRQVGFSEKVDERYLGDPGHRINDRTIKVIVREMYTLLEQKHVESGVFNPLKALEDRGVNEFVTMHRLPARHNELVTNGNSEPAVRISYLVRGSGVWTDGFGRATNMFVEFLLPRGVGNQVFEKIEKDPKFIRELAEKAVVDKFFSKNPASWNQPTSKETQFGAPYSTPRPNWEGLDKQPEGGRVYIQPEPSHIEPKWHPEYVREIK